MDIKTFEAKLAELNLSKKEFATMVGAAYNGVVNWNSKGETPKWVDSWLENYEKAKSYETMRDQVFRIEKIKQCFKGLLKGGLKGIKFTLEIKVKKSGF